MHPETEEYRDKITQTLASNLDKIKRQFIHCVLVGLRNRLSPHHERLVERYVMHVHNKTELCIERCLANAFIQLNSRYTYERIPQQTINWLWYS